MSKQTLISRRGHVYIKLPNVRALKILDGSILRTDDTGSYLDGYCDSDSKDGGRCSRRARFVLDGYACCGVHRNHWLNHHHEGR